MNEINLNDSSIQAFTKLNILKKIISLIICVALLTACNQSSNRNEPKENSHTAEETATALTLDNGAKWQADSSTNHHVTDLRTIANMFKVQPNPSLKEYQILGNDLGNSLNEMIQDCKMTGPDHEALHKWLEPVLNESNQLKNVIDTTTARVTFNLIDKRLDEYHNYFE